MFKFASLIFVQAFEDRNHEMKEIVEENGFVYEKHHVTTKDGYIL